MEAPRAVHQRKLSSWTVAACPTLPASNTASGCGFHPQMLWTIKFEQYLHHSPHTALFSSLKRPRATQASFGHGGVMVKAGSGTRRDRSMNTEDKHQAGLTPTVGARQQHTVTGRESPCTGEHTTAAMETTCAVDMQRCSQERSSTQADTQGR